MLNKYIHAALEFRQKAAFKIPRVTSSDLFQLPGLPKLSDVLEPPDLVQLYYI
jgi:hypothetical protein